jgi:hypothetical protein
MWWKLSFIAFFSYVFHKKYHKSLREYDHAVPPLPPALIRVIYVKFAVYFQLRYKVSS